MTKSIEAQGATLDAAVAAALAQLQMDRDSVSVEVLDNGRKGLFGIGSTPARVRVTYEIEEPVSRPAPVPVPTETPADKPETVARPSQAVKKEEEKPAYLPGNPLPPEEIPPVGREAIQFIDGLLEKLGVEGHAQVLDCSEPDHLRVEIVGPNMGLVIGRRGDTLDAIQYLTTLVANRNTEEHVRVSVDTERYRAKRAESLARLANKMAAKVVKYHKSMALEPMNPYERRVIHSTLQDYKGVTTYSTGTEPGRRVVIAPEGAAHTGPNRSGGRRGRGR